MSRRLVLAVTLVLTCPLFAEEFTPTVVHPVKFQISKKLSDTKPFSPKERGDIRTEHAVRQLPLADNYRGIGDAVVQTTATATAPIAEITGFEGIGGGLSIAADEKFPVTAMPPDIAGAIGIDQYVQWVNTSFAVFGRQGNLIYGPADGKTLWKGFGGPCENSNDGDPVVLFDRMASRWIMTQFAIEEEPFYQCIAVSTTSDATGTYALYQYPFDLFNDYPKFGVWPDAYYASYNMFKVKAFQGSRICAYDRAKMLAGQTADAQCVFVPNTKTNGGLLPADMEAASPPPVTPPNPILGLGKSQLILWKYSVNWTSPASSRLRGPTKIDVEPFIPACLRGPCVSQPPPGNPLDAISDRLMYRSSYRRNGTSDSLVVNHSVFVSGFGGPSSTGIRWYELHDVLSTPTVAQQATYSPDDGSRWLGSMAMDKVGNMAIGYSRSNDKSSPSIFLTGRSASDPPSILTTEVPVKLGLGTQSMSSWGDYSMLTVDPTDDCTFWFTNEYLVDADKDYRWHTYVAHTKFNNCQ